MLETFRVTMWRTGAGAEVAGVRRLMQQRRKERLAKRISLRLNLRYLLLRSQKKRKKRSKKQSSSDDDDNGDKKARRSTKWLNRNNGDLATREKAVALLLGDEARRHESAAFNPSLNEEGGPDLSSDAFIPIQVDGRGMVALLDSGASINTLSDKMYRKILNEGISVRAAEGKSAVRLVDIQGKTIHQRAKPVLLNVTIGGVSRQIPFRIIDSPTYLLLGLQAMFAFRMQINFTENSPSVRVDADVSAAPSQEPTTTDKRFGYSIARTCVEPGWNWIPCSTEMKIATCK